VKETKAPPLFSPPFGSFSEQDQQKLSDTTPLGVPHQGRLTERDEGMWRGASGPGPALSMGHPTHIRVGRMT